MWWVLGHLSRGVLPSEGHMRPVGQGLLCRDPFVVPREAWPFLHAELAEGLLRATPQQAGALSEDYGVGQGARPALGPGGGPWGGCG